MKIDKYVAALAFVGFCGLVFVLVASSAGCGSEDSADPVLVTVGTTDTSDSGDKPDVDASPETDEVTPDAETTQDTGGWTLPETCKDDEDCAPAGEWDWCTATIRCDRSDWTKPYRCVERDLPCQETHFVGCEDNHCLSCQDDDTATWQNCNDGSPCTAEFCAGGECQYGNTAGWCLISLSCYEAGEKSPGGGCSICDPDVSTEQFTPLPDGLDCDDGDPCTLDDACSEGKCESATPKTCNDGNVCTADSCVSWATNGCVYEALADDTPCADENLCNGQEACNAGNCVTTNPLVCNDGNVCNGEESCEATIGCIPGAKLVCNDGLPCNGEESCDAAKGCVVGVSPAGCCTNNAGCDDGNACNGVQACVTQTCKLLAEPLVCNDGDACNGLELCDPTKGCISTPAPNCDDGNVCTTDSCDPKSGCKNAALNGDVCNDDNACTVNDICTAGFCKPGPELDCDDKNPCTADACDSSKGCVFVKKNAACDDASKCTIGDVCTEGSCVSGKTLDCDDNNLCTTDSCDPAKGCVNKDVICDDGVLCTADSCDAKSGCKYAADDAECDDKNPCTADSCDAVGGCNNVAFAGDYCSDGNACTTDSCDAVKGCVNSYDVVCDDGVSCTLDSCDVFDGCKYAADNAQCEDGNKCTTNVCDAKSGCSATVTFSCDDDNPCTEDSCDPATGACAYFNPCDDGDECTEDICEANGSCSFQAKACNDGNPCTADICQDGACKFNPSSGATCNDGNPCTTDDLCVAGTCTGTAADYDADGKLDGEDSSCDHTYDVYKHEKFNPAGWSNQCGVGAKIADGTLVGILFRWDENVQKTAYGFCILDKDADGVSVLAGAKPGGDCNDDSSPIQYECWEGGKPLPTSVGEIMATIPPYLTVVVHPGEECPCFP